ncbi:MAG TPA: MtrB/PioB family decaheme-associated outer membrane protein [Methylomirabilota bacterium]|nr:MtrB/PioB family decaheme-associated outer membrane protein [Methylomirabilota bacterium]
MRAARPKALIVAALTVLGGADLASAQVSPGGLTLEGEVEAGGRFFIERPSPTRRAKFEEYRDLSPGPFLHELQLRLFRPDESYSVELGGSKWGHEDQEFSLGAGRLGLWQFGFAWDQIPHLYSTTARTLAVETDRGVFTLPAPRPALSTHNTPDQSEISIRWDTARMFVRVTPTPDLDLDAQYTRTHKAGDRPFGMAFGSPGNNFYEIVEPIDQTIHDLRLRATLARDRWQLQLGYALSMFQNSLSRVIADNPCFGNVASCGASDGGAAAPASGQIALAPDNMAHTLSLAGGVTLPLRTRLTANVAYSLRLQNETFLPHTINPAISDPALALPQDSLNGMVGTTLVNLSATSRPLRPLTLRLRYRLYDLQDMSDEPVFPGHVVDDRTLVVEDRRAGRFEYTRQNADADARMRLLRPLTITVGGGWERWDRNEHREVPTSDEYFARGALDATPLDWLLVRLTYRPSFRRIEEYDTFAHLVHTVVEEDVTSAAAQSQSPLLRKFDEGERDRQRVDLLLQFMPADAVTASVTGALYDDDYIASPLGLQDATTWSVGVDLTWAPLRWLSLYGGYTHEVIEQTQRSRSRPVSGGVTLDFADYDWIAVHTDTVDTLYAGTRIGLIPRVLDWSLDASYASALGRVQNGNPVTPASGTAAQDATATAKPWPAFEDRLLRLETALRYRFAKRWTAKLGYVFESFRKNDWRTDRLNPFIPGVTSIWLGNDARNYDAHMLIATLGYRFD